MDDTRVCRRCGKELPLTLDYFYRNGDSNYQYFCKSCMAIRKKEWASANKEKIREYDTRKRKERSDEQREKTASYLKTYYSENKDKIREQKHKYYLSHKDEVRENHKSNRQRINQCKLERENKKYREDSLFHIKKQCRNVIYKSFARKGLVKWRLAEDITGLPTDKLCEHLLETYRKLYGKDWDGREKVHIDHIVPLATATSEEDVVRLCHYSNLQLLKAFDNLSKHDKTDYKIERR